MVLSTVNNCSCARLGHFAKFQKRKSKFSEDQKRHLSHAVGRKAKSAKEEKEKKRKEEEESDSVSGNGGTNEGKDNGKHEDEPPQKTKDKGKGKAKVKYEERGADRRDSGQGAPGTDEQTPRAQAGVRRDVEVD